MVCFTYATVEPISHLSNIHVIDESIKFEVVIGCNLRTYPLRRTVNRVL